CQAYNTSPYTF
nr:immunoglobulin light chain junction region [Macaca mulatta]MOW40284.1 immunoglobulin light chain junction region [Macaca mulatta]